MKYLLLLFFTVTCFAQNTKIITYRLVNEDVDGPCSISSYVKWHNEGFLNYVTAESSDSIFAKNLLSLKKTSKKWRKTNLFCKPRIIGGDMIHNMFIIEHKGKRDTILATYNNEMIVFNNETKAYIDKNRVLEKMLPQNIKEFFDHDFKKQIMALYIRENDSIPLNKILYKESMRGFSIEDFKNLSDQFKLISSDSLYENIQRKYTDGNDTIQFYKNHIDITITSPDSNWNIDKVKPGDSEKLLFQKYPTSTKKPKFYLIRYEDIKRRYFYWVELIGNKGSITYFIKDRIIEKIEISIH